MACLTVNVLLWEDLSDVKSSDAGSVRPHSHSMSQAMFDQVIHYFFQNLSADTQACRDEERSLSYAQELSIEVPCCLSWEENRSILKYVVCNIYILTQCFFICSSHVGF